VALIVSLTPRSGGEGGPSEAEGRVGGLARRGPRRSKFGDGAPKGPTRNPNLVDTFSTACALKMPPTRTLPTAPPGILS
jgi:hypothetical protein